MVIRRDDEDVSKKQIIDSEELVPGDLIEISNEMILPADVALLFGSCVVEENNQEQKVISKTKIPFNQDSDDSVKKIEAHHIVYQGNKVLYTMNHINEGCYALVLKTGFAT